MGRWRIRLLTARLLLVILPLLRAWLKVRRRPRRAKEEKRRRRRAYRRPRDINACSQQVSLCTTGSTVLSTVQPETMLGAIGNRKKVWMETVLLVLGVPCWSLLDWPFFLLGPMGVPGRLSSTVDDESGFFETGENVCLFLGCFEACRQWRRRKGPFPPPSTFLPMAPWQENLFFPSSLPPLWRAAGNSGRRPFFLFFLFFWEGK